MTETTADGDTGAQISSEGPHPGVLGALATGIHLATAGAGAAADGSAMANATRLTDPTTTSADLEASSTGDGTAVGLAAALSESSVFPDVDATGSFSRARSAIDLSTSGGGSIEGNASADTSEADQ